jgi:cysteine desulfurase/selenocysteine lyase
MIAITENGEAESGDCPANSLDVTSIRKHFPILSRSVYGKPLVYLDSAATSQKPQPVIDALQCFYADECSNIHRGVHYLSGLATDRYDEARQKVQRFIKAASPKEIVFVRGTTEAINLVAQTYGRAHVEAGDEIVISALEHHSNIVPWQLLCREKQAHLRIAPINERGELLLDEFERLLNSRVKLVSLTHVSNALGTLNPLRQIIRIAHARNVPVLVDGAQAAPHLPVDVTDLDCDFYGFSGHKVCGPTGIGVLYGKSNLLEAMPPFQGGGGMISSVDFEEAGYNTIPHKFEAGTPNIAGAIALGAALDYLNQLGLTRVAAYEHELLAYASSALARVPGLRLVGTAREKVGVLSFVIEGVDCHEIGVALDQEGIAVRAGYHCAQPLLKRLGLSGTVRASLAFYNTCEEVDRLVETLLAVREILI